MSSTERYARSATFWRVIAGAACGAAVSTVIVATCLDDDERDRRPAEVGHVETTGAAIPRTNLAAHGAAPAITEPTGAAQPSAQQRASAAEDPTAEAPPDPLAEQAPDLQSAADTPPASSETGETGEGAPAQAAMPEDDSLEGAAASAEGGDAGAAVTAEGSEAAADAGTPAFAGSNPLSPPMSAGAGPFATEAPPNAASAFTTNPNAGAGRFTTEAPPYAASALSGPDPNTGAGAFTTEWRVGALPPSIPQSQGEGGQPPGASAQGGQGAGPATNANVPVAYGPTGLPILVTPAGLPVAVAPAGMPIAIGPGGVPFGGGGASGAPASFPTGTFPAPVSGALGGGASPLRGGTFPASPPISGGPSPFDSRAAAWPEQAR